jgi:RNA 2',3'-cyclic 3'-phosphodiesterase
VAKERLKSPRARLFVALDLPESVREDIARWQRRALTDPALRATRPEALHITLCFLGYHPERAIERITEIVAGVPLDPVELRFDPEPSAMPKGRPRLYAIGGRSESATRLQGQLEEALTAERFYEPEKRGFWPHVTVARVRSERLPPAPGKRRGKGRPRRVAKQPSRLPKALCEPFGAVRVALYRSNLKPQGAEYVRLGGVDLPSREGTEEVNEEHG